MKTQRILYCRLPCNPIFPIGIVYLSDHVHKLFPNIEQKILDLGTVPPLDFKKTLKDCIDEFKPTLLIFSWRDIQIYAPVGGRSGNPLQNAFEVYYSQNIFTRLRGALGGLKVVKDYYSELWRNVNLIKLGCNIKWIAKRSIKIVGVKDIKQIRYSVMFDRIEACTYLIAAAITEGHLKIKNVIPNVIKTEIDILKKIGVKIVTKKKEIKVIGNKKIKSINIKTAPYPGFPTDLQAQFMVLLCKANKESFIQENIFENRFMHVAELNRLGAQIKTKGNKVFVKGNITFAAAELMATDLRASVSLILAALTAKGRSVINRIYHLDRGYEGIEKKLKKVGAKIRRIN